VAWDFETEPEFEEKLQWMRGFVREEIFPIETLRLSYEQVLALIAPLQDEVRARGLWAAHLPPELGGMGFGQVKLGLMHEILGQSPYAPVVFGNNAPDSGNAELLAAGMEMTGREDIRARWLEPLLNGEIRSGFSMTEPNTAGSDPRLLVTSAMRDGDEWVINGRKWYTTNGSVADILIVMAVTNPEGRQDPARRGLDGRPARYLRSIRQSRGDPLRGRARASRPLDRARGFRFPPGPGAPRTGAHPSLHAVVGTVPAGL
jgi:acyl-CoA dehydrogenase